MKKFVARASLSSLTKFGLLSITCIFCTSALAVEPPVTPSPNSDSATSPMTTAPKPVNETPPPGFKHIVKLIHAAKYKEAAAKLEETVKNGTANSEAHLYLGGCYEKLKKYDKAMQQYEWVGKNAASISMRRKGQRSAKVLSDLRAGICPGNCLKLSSPGWQRRQGYSGLWMTFHTHKRIEYLNQDAIGQILTRYPDGRVVPKGPCPICGGTTRVKPLK